MNKEPIGLYIFRYVMGFAVVAFLAMIYWSNLLLEENLNDLAADVKQFREEVQDKLAAQGTRPIAMPVETRTPVASEAKSSTYPNLLKVDRFYAETLPRMLGPDFKPQGTYRTATIGKPENLHPFSNWAEASSWNSMCNVNVATGEFGKFETMAPDMAVRMELRPTADGTDEEYWVFLRDNVYWEPLNPAHFPAELQLSSHFQKKHKVTAHDFKFYFDAAMNANVSAAGAASLRTYLGDIVDFRVIDDTTFVVRWKSELTTDDSGKTVRTMKYTARGLTGSLQPLAEWVWKYFSDGKKIVEDDADPDTYRTSPVWAQNFQEHWARHVIVSCGVWLFDGMSDESIRFRRNPNHYSPLASLIEKEVVYFRESPDSIWQDFKEGRLDTYSLRPDQLTELDEFMATPEYKKQESAGNGIGRIDYLARSFAYIGWNQKTPYFSSAKVRRAMTLAIDRERVIDQNLNRMGTEISGPFFKMSPSYDSDIRPYPYDVHQATALLEEEGWFDSNGDGIRDKVIDGKSVPFQFTLTYFVKNPTSKQNAEYIATVLKEVGVDCRLNGVDLADLSAQFDEKNFDALYLGWALGAPPEEPKQIWHSSGAAEKGSSNAVGFANPEADKIIDRLQYEHDIAQRNMLYHRFHRIIHDEEPYTFLYTPKVTLLYRQRVQNVLIPSDRQDLIPGANVAAPDSSIFWLKNGER